MLHGEWCCAQQARFAEFLRALNPLLQDIRTTDYAAEARRLLALIPAQ